MADPVNIHRQVLPDGEVRVYAIQPDGTQKLSTLTDPKGLAISKHNGKVMPAVETARVSEKAQ
jgi:hypothetical protein